MLVFSHSFFCFFVFLIHHVILFVDSIKTVEIQNHMKQYIEVSYLNSLQGTNAESQKLYVAAQDMTALRDDVTESGLGIGKENASNLRSNSCSRPSLGVDCRSHKGLINGSQSREDNRCGSVQVAERHDHASDTCTAESIQALNVSPDDVVGLMGEKLFWKVRRAILK